MNRAFLYTFLFALSMIYGTFYFVHSSHRGPSSLSFETPVANVPRQPSNIITSADPYNLEAQRQQELAAYQAYSNSFMQYPSLINSSYPYGPAHTDLRNTQYLAAKARMQQFNNRDMVFLAQAQDFSNVRYRRQWYENRRSKLISEMKSVVDERERKRAENKLTPKWNDYYAKKEAEYNQRIQYVSTMANLELQKEMMLQQQLFGMVYPQIGAQPHMAVNTIPPGPVPIHNNQPPLRNVISR